MLADEDWAVNVAVDKVDQHFGADARDELAASVEAGRRSAQSCSPRARGDGACQRWRDNGDRIAHARKRVAVSAGFETACCQAVQSASRLLRTA
jgi:hypothetical protein